MADTPTGRPLGRFETALTLTGEHAPFAIVVAVGLEGTASPEAVRRALDGLQREQPLLRTGIEERRGRYHFRVAAEAPPVPLEVVPRRSDADWQAVVEGELNRGLDRGGPPLVRAHLLHPEVEVGRQPESSNRSELVLALHHALVDAAAGERLVSRLLALIADPTASLEAGAAPDVLPPPTDALLPPAHNGVPGAGRRLAFVARQLADEARWRWRRRGAGDPEIPASGRCRVLPLHLDEGATAGLVRRARRRRVTLNAALQAALLLATVRRHPDCGTGPHRYVTFADLRPYLKPPPDAGRLGCHISMLRYTVPGISPDTPFWDLARSITLQVGAGAHRGDPFAAAHLAPVVMRQSLRRGDQRMGTAAVSYSGVTRIRRRHGDLAVRDLHAFISNFPLGPVTSAGARLLDGALHVDLLTLDCDMDAAGMQGIGDEILALLGAKEAAE